MPCYGAKRVPRDGRGRVNVSHSSTFTSDILAECAQHGRCVPYSVAMCCELRYMKIIAISDCTQID